MTWAMRRRAGQAAAEPSTTPTWAVGPVELDVRAHRVQIEGHVVHLPAREAALLAVLMRNPGRVMTAAELHAAANGQVQRPEHVRRLVQRLSRRLTVNPLVPPLIERVPPGGYRFTRIPMS